MADESFLDKAIGLIPGVGVKKTRRKAPARPSQSTHIANLKKGIAKLASDLEKFIGLAGGKAARKTAPKKPATATKKPAKRPAAARKSAAKRTVRKTARKS